MNRALWKKLSQVVEAEQVTVDYQPEGVELDHLGISGKVGANKYALTMLTPFGRIMLPVGAWIVYDEEGARAVPQAVFERVYQPVTVAGKGLAMGKRVVRRIVGA